MNGRGVEELRKSYLVACLNVEKSERTVGHLARFLAGRAMVHRLAAIAAEQRLAGDGHASAGSLRGRLQPVPLEVAEALRELREWRDAALHAYQRIPEADRQTLARPARPWPSARSPAAPGLA